MPTPPPLHVIDSHTGGEPTRVIISGGPDLGTGPLSERLHNLRTHFDTFRSAVVCEPRGSQAVVAALLLEPEAPTSSAGVIFFNDCGYLGMCGHGTIGLITTLAHLGRIQPGGHIIETPTGDISARLHSDGSVTVGSVPSFRFRAGVRLDVPGLGPVVGDIAWSGNWFFLVNNPPAKLTLSNHAQLVAAAGAIRLALQQQGITGPEAEAIEYIEFFAPPLNPRNSSRNFVLCPGASFDRSPCGTGTSAMMACLFADGHLAPGDVWRQEGILGTVFEGSIEAGDHGTVHPRVRGKAWIIADARLFFAEDDPFRAGIQF